MQHALVSMLVTSVTTTAAFFSSYISSITAIKCFRYFHFSIFRLRTNSQVSNKFIQLSFFLTALFKDTYTNGFPMFRSLGGIILSEVILKLRTYFQYIRWPHHHLEFHPHDNLGPCLDNFAPQADADYN